MSAITGIFNRNGLEVKPELMKKMNNRLSHRGLDGSGIYCNGPVAMGHQMLKTTPESLHEKLPFHDEKTGLTITADARIDNRQELSEKLGISDRVDVPDSYFILKSYQKWGEKCPEELIGDFAFVIWDEINETLFCARDHIGVKPFYYYLSDDLFLMGTEIKAFFALDNVQHSLNEKQIAEHLTFILENKDETFFENIHRLPPATTLTLNYEKERFNQYWALDPTFELQLDSSEAYTREFLKIFKEAVRCRLRSAFPVGSMLSGGLDTTSVVSTAQNIRNDPKEEFYGEEEMTDSPMKTFSAVFNDVPECDEQYYIKMTLSEYDLDSHYVHADQISPIGDVDEFFRCSDQPFLFPNTFMLWNLYRKASENGVRILLDGFDGDTVVSYGEGIFRDLIRSGRWGKYIHEINETAKKHWINQYNYLLNKSISTLTPKFMKKLKWELTKFTPLDNRNKRSVNKDLVKSTGLVEKLRKDYETELNVENSRHLHYYFINMGLVQMELEQVDWAAARFGIEPRHPFYDKRLLEFCLSLPVEQKRQDGFDRLILRRAMENIIPEGIRQRIIKTDLGPNFDNNMLKMEHKRMNNLIIENSPIIEKYVDIPFLQEKYQEYLTGNTEFSNEIWDILVFGLWLEKNSV